MKYPPPGRSRFNAMAFIVVVAALAVPILLVVALVWALLRWAGGD